MSTGETGALPLMRGEEGLRGRYLGTTWVHVCSTQNTYLTPPLTMAGITVRIAAQLGRSVFVLPFLFGELPRSVPIVITWKRAAQNRLEGKGSKQASLLALVTYRARTGATATASNFPTWERGTYLH